MPLPALQRWDATARQLHYTARFLSSIRVALTPPQNNHVEFSLKPVQQGLSTDTLPGGGEAFLDFGAVALRFQPAEGAPLTVPLNGKTYAQAFNQFLKTLKDGPGAAVIGNSDDDSLLNALLGALAAKGHRMVDETKLGEVMAIDGRHAGEYAAALYMFYSAIARFRARLGGYLTPMVVWSEHFDLSMLWFLFPDMDERKPHLNIGFAPYSPGLPRPYLYAYAYPYPADVEYPALPAPARWHADGWTGVVVDYDDIAKTSDPEATIETLCMRIFAALRPLLR